MGLACTSRAWRLLALLQCALLLALAWALLSHCSAPFLCHSPSRTTPTSSSPACQSHLRICIDHSDSVELDFLLGTVLRDTRAACAPGCCPPAAGCSWHWPCQCQLCGAAGGHAGRECQGAARRVCPAQRACGGRSVRSCRPAMPGQGRGGLPCHSRGPSASLQQRAAECIGNNNYILL